MIYLFHHNCYDDHEMDAVLELVVLEISMEGEIFSMDRIALKTDNIVVGFGAILFALDTSHNRLKSLNHPHLAPDLYSNLQQFENTCSEKNSCENSRYKFKN